MPRPLWLADACRDPGPQTPCRIAQACAQNLGIEGVGVSVRTGRGAQTRLCATDERALLLEDAQATAGVGPCLDAMTRGAPVLLPDLHDDPGRRRADWPGFTDMADAAGVRALFCLPLHTATLPIGTVSLHRAAPGPLRSDELTVALLAAEAIADCLLTQNLPGADGPLGLPWPSADPGVIVHQATGMVQVQLGTDAPSALLLLRARAFRDGLPLSGLAQDVVDRRVRFS